MQVGIGPMKRSYRLRKKNIHREAQLMIATCWLKKITGIWLQVGKYNLKPPTPHPT